MAESIYNLIPQPVPPVIQPPRYLSKHGGDKPPTFSTFGLTGTSKPGFSNIAGAEAEPASGHHAFKKPHATMGREGNAKPPSEMLKKGTGGGGGAADANANTSTSAFKYSATKRPGVPSKEELRQLSQTLKQNAAEPKNFITSNAVENILAVPKREEEGVDWLKKPHFGEVPPYLTKIKQEINDEYEYIKSMQQQQDDGPAGMRLMAEEERQELIVALKKKWDQVNKTYQGSSVLSLASLDTIGKVKRKEMYEAQLSQIEKDIEKLSKKAVYVAE